MLLMSSWAKVARNSRSDSVKRVAAEETDGDKKETTGTFRWRDALKKKATKQKVYLFPVSRQKSFSPVPPFFRFSHDIRGSGG